MEFVLCVVIMKNSADYASREKFVVYPIKTVYTNLFYYLEIGIGSSQEFRIFASVQAMQNFLRLDPPLRISSRFSSHRPGAVLT